MTTWFIQGRDFTRSFEESKYTVSTGSASSTCMLTLAKNPNNRFMSHGFQAVPTLLHYFVFLHMSTNSLLYNASHKSPANENQIYEYVVPWVLLGTFSEVGITCHTSSNLEANLSKANLSSGLFATVNSLAISYQSCSETPAWVPSGPVVLLLPVLLVCFKKAFNVTSVWDLSSDLPN